MRLLAGVLIGAVLAWTVAGVLGEWGWLVLPSPPCDPTYLG